ncbi:insulin-like [Sphaeramia orbicularis]|uniref:insulin-like n=1 Tax=Sphaeramia orbicularis TaxID=375764 RepID=UPI00117D934B|nr:insulin-like [Sphaeramia orbicularis]
MASLWLQSASLLVLLVMLCPDSSSTQEIPLQHLCGSHLVEALNLVCGSKGFYSSTRRDVLPSNENDIKDQMGRMVKRHIVEQCCHKPCSLAVLEMYCN